MGVGTPAVRNTCFVILFVHVQVGGGVGGTFLFRIPFADKNV